MTKVVDFEVEQDEIAGVEGGFLAVRRLRLRNVREDGTRSRLYVCDFLVRPKGIDAVVVAVYHRSGGGVQVLLREGLRPVLANGREPDTLPIPDARPYLTFTEVVAGILLGPSLLGWIWPEAMATLFAPSSLPGLQMLAQVGLVLFMFLVGLELDPRLLEGRAKSSVLISHTSIVVPFGHQA